MEGSLHSDGLDSERLYAQMRAFGGLGGGNVTALAGMPVA